MSQDGQFWDIIPLPGTSIPLPKASSPPHLLFLSLALQRGGQDGELEDRCPSLVLDRHIPQLLPVQASVAGEWHRTFQGYLQALDIPFHQEVLQDTRVAGEGAPTSCPTSTDPWLFTTMKTLLECPGCSVVVL